MSYLVLVLGGFLSLAGAAVIHASYPVIEVERGWAGVIAGTVALTSGTVTIALGLILHRLSSFHTLLSAGRNGSRSAGTAFKPRPSPHSKSANLIEAPAGSQAILPASGLRSWPQRHARPSHAAGRGISKPAPPPLALNSHEPAAPIEVTDEAGAASHPPGSGQEMPPGPKAEAARLAPAGPSAVEAGPSAVQGEGNNPRLPSLENEASSDRLAGPSLEEAAIAARDSLQQPLSLGMHWPAEHALAGASVPEAAEAADGGVDAIQKWAEETWPGLQKDEVPDSASGLGEEPAPPHPMECATGDELPSGHAIASDTLAIVGRHESEGTSYVMYADGSIEARRDHAVFHFKSMAELKSFMESQAQTREQARDTGAIQAKCPKP